MPNFANSKIYKIICNDQNLIYIGSTCAKLSRRFCQHKSKYKLFLDGKNSKPTKSINCFAAGGAQIILIEELVLNSKIELIRRERYWIEKLNCCNKVIPGRTRAEYYIDNKDEIKQYYIDNKDRIKQYRSKHYLDNKDRINAKIVCNCSRIVFKRNLIRHKRSKIHRHLMIIKSHTAMMNELMLLFC